LEFEALSIEYRAISIEYRAVSIEYRALFIEYWIFPQKIGLIHETCGVFLE